MTARTKATCLFVVAMSLLVVPYFIVFAVGSVWMWRNGWVWYWAIGTGVPSIAGLTLLERARRLFFPPPADLPHAPAASATTGQAARCDVRAISERIQADDPPLEQPDVLEKVVRNVLQEVLETVARHYYPQSDHPVLQVPVARIAGIVELVARDFRQAFSENVPWGKNLTPSQLHWWKQKGELAWRIGTYLWQVNRIRRVCMRPGMALVQEVQDHYGQNVTAKSVDRLKRWAIDYCVTKAGDYAIQLYSGGFVLDDEYRSRVSAQAENAPFSQEPLQVLVVGQTKAGKSSLINLLLGEVLAPVDALPTTDAIDLYECQPAGLPRMILRDTPGYGAADDNREPFVQLACEIEECDLLVMLCTARSAARKADRDLLRTIHEFYQRNPKRIMPPVVCVLTHVDTIPQPLHAELAEAVAEDLGVALGPTGADETAAGQIAMVCTAWGRIAHGERIVAAIQANLAEAERLKCARCIRQIRKEQDDDKVLRQLLGGLRLTGGWIARKT